MKIGFEPRIGRSRSPQQHHYNEDRFRSPPREKRSYSPIPPDRFRSRSPRRSYSPQNQPQAPSRKFSWWNHNPKETVDGIVKEFIDEFTGLMEVFIQGDSYTAFFHATSIWLTNLEGNPYGEPVKFSDKLGKNTATTREDKNVHLHNELPIGSEVFLQVLPVQSEVVQFVVLFSWPKSTDYPPFPKVETEQKILEKKHEYYLKEFHNKLESKPKVDATFPGCISSLYPDVEASVWDIKAEENFGTIEIKGTRPKTFRFFCLFHRDDVWLRDGKRGISVDYFKNKPLKEMCRVGQPVNVIARSIIVNKGADLAPAVMELQAVIVSLNPVKLPDSACKPTW